MSVLGKKYWKTTEHACVIETADMATGVAQNRLTPVTAFRYKCVLCGRTYDVLTRFGMEQLRKYDKKKALHWSITRKK